MAKDLVRTRRYIQKFYQIKTQLQAVSLQIQVMDARHLLRDNEIESINDGCHERSDQSHEKHEQKH